MTVGSDTKIKHETIIWEKTAESGRVGKVRVSVVGEKKTTVGSDNCELSGQLLLGSKRGGRA